MRDARLAGTSSLAMGALEKGREQVIWGGYETFPASSTGWLVEMVDQWK